MSSDYGQFQRGAVAFPLPTSPFVEARALIDPALDAAIKFWAWAIRAKIGAYWDALASQPGYGAAELVGKVIASEVPHDPSPYFRENMTGLPMLAVWRASEAHLDHTISWTKTEADVRLLYVLPAFDAARALHFAQVLKAVSTVILDRTVQGFDPDYLGGASVWGSEDDSPGPAGIMMIDVLASDYGVLTKGDPNQPYPCVQMTCRMTERSQKNPGLEQLALITASINVRTNNDPADDVNVAEIEVDTQ